MPNTAYNRPDKLVFFLPESNFKARKVLVDWSSGRGCYTYTSLCRRIFDGAEKNMLAVACYTTLDEKTREEIDAVMKKLTRICDEDLFVEIAGGAVAFIAPVKEYD